jgi:hypothetical protein
MLKFCSTNDQKDALNNISPIEPLLEQEEARNPIRDDSTNVELQSSSNVIEGHSLSPTLISSTSTITTPPFIIVSMSKLVFFTILLFGTVHFFVLVRRKKKSTKVKLVGFINIQYPIYSPLFWNHSLHYNL